VADLSEEAQEQKQIATEAKNQEMVEELRSRINTEIRATKEEIDKELKSKDDLLTDIRECLHQAQMIRTEMATIKAEREIGEREKKKYCTKDTINHQGIYFHQYCERAA